MSSIYKNIIEEFSLLSNDIAIKALENACNPNCKRSILMSHSQFEALFTTERVGSNGGVRNFMNNPTSALNWAFEWRDTPEGQDFWSNVYYKLESKRPERLKGIIHKGNLYEIREMAHTKMKRNNKLAKLWLI